MSKVTPWEGGLEYLFLYFFRGESAITQAGRVPPEQLSSKLGYAAVKIPNKEARVAPWDSRSFL